MTENNQANPLIQILLSEVPQSAIENMVGVQTVDLAGRTAVVVTLTSPAQLNALSLAGWRRLCALFETLSRDPGLRVVVIRGAGGRAFSAGADISEFPRERLGANAASGYNRAISSALEAIQGVTVPVIAMVGGLAVGGGCELAAACDVRIASDDSRFGIPVGKLGVILGLTETRAVSAAIGAANLKYLLFSGELVDASQAFVWGLVQQVVVREDLAIRTATLAWSIVTSSETTIRASKLITTLAADPAVDEQHPNLLALEVETYNGDDLREGVSAFLAHRAPRFGLGRGQSITSPSGTADQSVAHK